MTETSGKESAWLEQLVGQWDVTFNMKDHPAWREETRAIGGGWILAETSGPMEGGSEGRMVMMLECEGPDPNDPGRVALYRDIITVIDADTRKLSSITQAADGTWKPVMACEYKRKTAA